MSTQDSLRPRAHGIAVTTDDSDLFTGRVHAQRAIADWLGRPSADPSALVVTGAPGSGKSALLARVWQRHAFDVAVNAHGQTAGDVLRMLGTAIGCTGSRPADLVAAARRHPLLAIVDSVEEATDPDDLVAGLLSPLVRLGPAAGIRLLLGLRRPVPARLAESVRVIDLDSREYEDPAGIVEYVTRYLRTHGPAMTDEVAARLARRVAAVAGPSYFVAHVIVRNVADRGRPASPDWHATLPATATEAVAWDLRERLTPTELARAEDLLAPLAFALGDGLPWEDVWAPAATSAAGRPYDDRDLAWLRRELGWYVHEVVDSGRLRYRLCHQVVADHLRTTREPAATHAAIASCLVRRLPRGVGAAHDWTGADAYALTYLSTHAAAGGELDRLLDDPGFLLRSARPALLTALHSARTAEGRAAADAFRSLAAGLGQAPTPEDVSRLELAAHRTGATRLAAEVERARMHRPWATLWALWSPAPRPRTLASGHAGAALAVGTVHIGRKLFVLTGGEDGTVRVWDADGGHPTGPPLATSSGAIRAIAGTTWRGQAIAVTVGDRGLYRWDVSAGTGSLLTLSGAGAGLTAVALTEHAGRCVLLGGLRDGRLGVWDVGALGEARPASAMVGARPASAMVGARPASAIVEARPASAMVEARAPVIEGVLLGHLPGDASAAHAGAVRAIGVEAARATIVVSIGDDRMARVWDLASGRAVGRSIPVPGIPMAAAGRAGRPIAITADGGHAVRAWDLQTGEPASERLTGHTAAVTAAAVAIADPHTMAAASADGRVLVWRLPTGTAVPPAVTNVRHVVGDTDRVWIAGDDGAVCAVDSLTGKPLGPPAVGHEGPVSAAVAGWTDAEPVLLTGGDDGQVVTWSRLSGRPVTRPWVGTGARVLHLAATERLAVALVAGDPDAVELWDIAARTRLGQLGRHLELTAAAVAILNGRPLVVTGTAGGGVAVWDPSARPTSTVRPMAALGQHQGAVTVLAATTHGSRMLVVSGAADHTAMRWTIDGGRGHTRIDPEPGRGQARARLRVEGPVTAVASQSARFAGPLAFVAADANVHVWGATGNIMRIRMGEPVTALGHDAQAILVGTERGIAAIQPRAAVEPLPPPGRRG